MADSCCEELVKDKTKGPKPSKNKPNSRRKAADNNSGENTKPLKANSNCKEDSCAAPAHKKNKVVVSQARGTRTGLRSQDKPHHSKVHTSEASTDPRWKVISETIGSLAESKDQEQRKHKSITIESSGRSKSKGWAASAAVSGSAVAADDSCSNRSETSSHIHLSSLSDQRHRRDNHGEIIPAPASSSSQSKKKESSRKRSKDSAAAAAFTERPTETLGEPKTKSSKRSSSKSRSRPKNSKSETQVATTGETSSRLKRSTTASSSASADTSASGSAAAANNSASTSSDPSCSSRSAAWRRHAGRGTRSATRPSATSSSTTLGSESVDTHTASDSALHSFGANVGMSNPSQTSNNNDDNAATGTASESAGNSAANADEMHPMTAGLLSDVLQFGSSDGASSASQAFDLSAAAASDPDLQRLQAMLEAHRLPPHLFGALGSSMRHILHRSMNNGTITRVQSLVKGMQTKDDEGTQLTAVMEMCQVLVMGNEDSLAGFPVKQVVPELIALLHMEHNFDIMNHACRALTYMLEALPRSSPIVVEAVPALLDKLKCIQCMDVAEQSLSALEMLSRRHNKNMLQAGAISACLMYLDFFSTVAQRSALAVAANCCANLSPSEFHYVKESLPLLSSKLLTADKKSVESVCLCFSRLVDNLHKEEKLLKELAAHEMLANMLKLLVIVPSVISSNTFTMVIRMFVVMCNNCPELAVCLLRQNIADTLVYLLSGQQEVTKTVELVSRSPQELYEIVSLIGELMPALPTSGLFAVDTILKKHPSMMFGEEEATWQWKDDKGTWKNYSPIDSRIIEAAYEGSEEEVSLATSGRMYTLDFTMMQQINEETGTSRSIQRLTDSAAKRQNPSSSGSGHMTRPDARAEVLAEQPDLAHVFIKSLFGLLYEVYSSSAGPAVRHKCLQALLRQIYYASPELLHDVLTNQPVSSHIASMLASQDHKVVVGALQMADILMKKLPMVFSQYFQRQGVVHQIKLLSGSDDKQAEQTTPEVSTSAAGTASGSTANSKESTEAVGSKSKTKMDASASSLADSTSSVTDSGTSAAAAEARPRKSSSKKALKATRGKTSQGEFGDISFKRKTSSRKEASQAAGSGAGSSSSKSKSSKTSFLANLNPRHWGRSSSGADRSPSASNESRGVSTATLMANYREKIKSWIVQHATEFLSEHFSKSLATDKSDDVLQQLSDAASLLSKSMIDGAAHRDREALEKIAQIVKHDNISPFEMIHSGLLGKLLEYLTSSTDVASTSSAITDMLLPHGVRLATFLNVFIGSPATPGKSFSQDDMPEDNALQYLVAKALSCLHQQEQFQVKVHDLGASANSASSAMKFFSTHQLKCQLQRHPDCKTLKQWKNGPVKVDPLALVQAIERYLIIRGYCKSRSDSPEAAASSLSTAASAELETISDDADSDDELDDSMAAMLMAQSSGKHKLEFLIGDKVLPYNMTVYQAVKNHAPLDNPDHDSESDHGLGSAAVWAQTHLIWYRPAPEVSVLPKTSSGSSSKRSKTDSSTSHNSSSGRSKGKHRKSHDFFTDGVVPTRTSPLLNGIMNSLLNTLSVKDSSMDSLALMRALYNLNRYWGTLYDMTSYKPVVSPTEFISSKLTAKANRQLQDPLVIMTGNIPQWLPQVSGCCPFLFPFETRQMLFYVCSFDRDRAMLRLQDTGTDTTDADNSRVSPPQLDKKKKTVSRINLLKQAEKIMDEIANSKALLEIQYENEAGTGLGPTLEFYSLVSKELQSADLDLWHGQTTKVEEGDGSSKSYVIVGMGLYPKPLARNAKPAQVAKVKAKFKFIGKLMAKALMDSRLLDIPLNPIVYTWLLGQQKSLTAADLHYFDPTLASSYSQLQSLADKAKQIKSDASLSDDQTDTALESLGIEDLCLDFTWPGYSSIQLKKGGKDESVTAANIEEYLQLLCHWVFHEGIHRQMESLKEGFDQVFSSASLTDLFSPLELEQLFCGNKSNKWEAKDLYDCCRADHGYTLDSKAVQNLFDILSSYDSTEQREFLSFVTGAPRLPVGGFRSLNPPLTIVRKAFEANENPDDFLPSVMTCANYLKLPDYTTIDIMREKLSVASSIGQHSFHLS